MEATTVIGYKIKTDGFFNIVEKPSCSHIIDKNLKFCPECGIKVDVLKKRQNNEYEELFFDLINSLPEGYVHNSLYDNEGDICWFGYGQTVGYSDGQMLPLKSYDEIKIEIHVILKPFIDSKIIVLNDKEFGIWTIYTSH